MKTLPLLLEYEDTFGYLVLHRGFSRALLKLFRASAHPLPHPDLFPSGKKKRKICHFPPFSLDLDFMQIWADLHLIKSCSLSCIASR